MGGVGIVGNRVLLIGQEGKSGRAFAPYWDIGIGMGVRRNVRPQALSGPGYIAKSKRKPERDRRLQMSREDDCPRPLKTPTIDGKHLRGLMSEGGESS